MPPVEQCDGLGVIHLRLRDDLRSSVGFGECIPLLAAPHVAREYGERTILSFAENEMMHARSNAHRARGLSLDCDLMLVVRGRACELAQVRVVEGAVTR